LKVVQLLLQDKRVDPSDNNNAALLNASENGHLEIVRLLCRDDRVLVMSVGASALNLACSNGHLETVEYLIETQKVDPSYNSDNAFYTACWYGHESVIRYLLQHEKVNPNTRNGSPLADAICYGKDHVVSLLLASERVKVCLHFYEITSACKRGFVKVIELLIVDERVELNPYNLRDTFGFYLHHRGNDPVLKTNVFSVCRSLLHRKDIRDFVLSPLHSLDYTELVPFAIDLEEHYQHKQKAAREQFLLCLNLVSDVADLVLQYYQEDPLPFPK
jgi:hypothetical protein